MIKFAPKAPTRVSGFGLQNVRVNKERTITMETNQPEIPGIEEALRDIDEVRKRELVRMRCLL